MAASLFTLTQKNHLPDIYMADQGAVIAVNQNDTLYISGKQGSFFYDQWKEEVGANNVEILESQETALSRDITLITNPWSKEKGDAPCLVASL